MTQPTGVSLNGHCIYCGAVIEGHPCYEGECPRSEDGLHMPPRKLPDVPAPVLALPLRSKPVEPPWCTCDWGDCELDAVSWRWASGHGWLPVCAHHIGEPV